LAIPGFELRAWYLQSRYSLLEPHLQPKEYFLTPICVLKGGKCSRYEICGVSKLNKMNTLALSSHLINTQCKYAKTMGLDVRMRGFNALISCKCVTLH
jgi:hypothetical protein